jgi:hypothetical protein
MKENLCLQMLQRFTNQLVRIDTPIGLFQGILRKTDASQHNGVGNLLLETLEGQPLLIKAWSTVKSPLPTANATLSRSLHSADTPGKKCLNRKAVANNMIKPSLDDHGENPLSWNVERLRNMGVWKI